MKYKISICIFVLHWVLVAYSVIPNQYKLEPINKIVRNYTGLFFYQKWRLFAPEPALFSKKVKYRCRYSSVWSNWHDPIDSLLEKHYSNRIAIHGRLLRIPLSHATWLGNDFAKIYQYLKCKRKDISCNKKTIQLTMKMPSYIGARKYSKNKCLEKNNKKKLEAIQFTIAKKIVVLKGDSFEHKYRFITFNEDVL